MHFRLPEQLAYQKHSPRTCYFSSVLHIMELDLKAYCRTHLNRFNKKYMIVGLKRTGLRVFVYRYCTKTQRRSLSMVLTRPNTLTLYEMLCHHAFDLISPCSRERESEPSNIKLGWVFLVLLY